MSIVQRIGEAAALEQLAEECAELSHAALKLARVIRQENPTPVTREDAYAALHEEGNDVLLCLKVLAGDNCFRYDMRAQQGKAARWLQRLQEQSAAGRNRKETEAREVLESHTIDGIKTIIIVDESERE